MTDYYNQEEIIKITSPNSEFVCFLQQECCDVQIPGHHQKVILYRVVNKDLIYLKSLFGKGVFLNNTTLLIFIDTSGYGPCETDCYLYDINSDVISPLYYDNFDALCEHDKAGGSFVSSDILVTPNFLILKTIDNEIFFYNKPEILSLKKLDLIYCLPLMADDDNSVEKLLGFNERTNILEYSSNGIIKRKEIDFKKPYNISRQHFGLNLSRELYEGYAMDFNTVLSSINSDGTIQTQKSELCEYLHQLKYNFDTSVENEIAQKVSEYFKSRTGFYLYDSYTRDEIDILIPIPSSNPQNNNPLENLWIKISQLTKIPIDTKYLIKTKVTSQIKSIDDKKKRENILRDSLSVVDNRYHDKNVVLLDDTYCSGSTLNVAASILKTQGGVKNIYALTILKIRSNSNLSIS